MIKSLILFLIIFPTLNYDAFFIKLVNEQSYVTIIFSFNFRKNA